MDVEELLEVLKNAECSDPFECIFSKYGKNKQGCYGCFAERPHGDPNEENQGCVAYQAARLIESFIEAEHEKK